MDKNGYPTPFRGKVGQRVYWHGIFPDPTMKGTIKATGTVRHEVLWDGRDQTSLEWIGVLQSVTAAVDCCAYCISWRDLHRRGLTRQSQGIGG